MKKIIVAAILAVVATTPALAQYRYYLAGTRSCTTAKIIGQDPDPNVRLDLRKNSDFYAGYQP